MYSVTLYNTSSKNLPTLAGGVVVPKIRVTMLRIVAVHLHICAYFCHSAKGVYTQKKSNPSEKKNNQIGVNIKSTDLLSSIPVFKYFSRQPSSAIAVCSFICHAFNSLERVNFSFFNPFKRECALRRVLLYSSSIFSVIWWKLILLKYAYTL